MANFGNFCLLFALCLSGYALFAALIGAAQRQQRIVRSAERAAYSATAGVTLAFLSLLYLLLSNDLGYIDETTKKRLLQRNLEIGRMLSNLRGSIDKKR